ncbi:formylmethanofuran--tetrahydromethanopterin N-formyltransferase [Rubinisphaera margarita]|uniref:formylmethanofuran--tetrahydromethanopterin N-formyltransferase n=1 Tax=Rubinisphaera margarita TaxID=2909586 RepID=UPI001EE7F88C|nr:formylmethanofuran--tetrahydromethanopterin N-formyltransferase [Rubinisphaera margarita]MCG6156160.1 formylmethanofuran--tetrahydromethanopterin N-formyltransferase [Rubinisphaera margarita]
MNRFRWRNLLLTETFAEAFSVTGTRILVTAETERWVEIAAREVTGYGTSVISCDAEAGLDQMLCPEETPDGRPGAALMFFTFNRDALAKAMISRVGQCLLTCPTTAVFNGVDLSDEEPKFIDLGNQLRYFGDGFQASKVIGDRRYWRIPVMDGEFLCEDRIESFRGVAGGNVLIGGETQAAALRAAESATDAMRECPQVILPFPGGIVRSGSKVGSRYKALRASTYDAYCPTLKARTETCLLPETSAVYEIVIDGRSADHVGAAMRAGLDALSECDGVTEVSAGNYGGKLGKHHFHLRALTEETATASR